MLLAVPAAQAAPQLDQYGGVMSLSSPGNKTGKWSVEKYPTPDGRGRWLMTTPDGHGLWCGSQYALAKPTSLNLSQKYGSQLNWETAALARYTGWGFNCMAEYPDISLVTDMNAGLLGKRIPYFNGDHFVIDAVYRRRMIAGQVLPADAVKDLSYATVKYTGWRATVADGFDPNFAPYVANFAAARIAPGNLAHDPYAKADMNPWNMAMSIDDADYMYGFGPGPDECVTPDGSYHAHIGWMALASPMNLYAQWYDTKNPYNGYNWIFNDTKVYAKDNLVAFLKARYGNNIASLNAAWGSAYTAFDSARTRYAGEVVGTTNGAVSSLPYTLAHPGGVSPASILIKVDGIPMATDPPRSPGAIAGRWPDGATTLGGTINYSDGSMTINSSDYHQFNQPSPGTATWGDISLGETNIIPGTLILRMEGSGGNSAPDCRITDDNRSGHSWGTSLLCPGSPYTVTGTIDYSLGVISGLTITPAIPSSYWVQFQFYRTSPLPGTHTVTVDYDVNGFGVGTTLADEDGSHTAWLGSKDGLLRKSQVPPAVWTDLSAWLGNYTEQYYANTIDVLRPYFPGKLITAQMSGLGGHYGCTRKEMAIAASHHSDILLFSQITPPLLAKLVAWGLGDKPVMDAWEGLVAQPDSPFSAYTASWAGSPSESNTQAARGAAVAAKISQALTGRGSGGTSYQILGIKFWAYSDTTGENANYGLVSPLDNAYDGHEATTGTHACSAPLEAYQCGGESSNYGDAITPITQANQSIYYTLTGETPPPVSPPGNPPGNTVVTSPPFFPQIYPNPWRSDKHAAHPKVTFAGLTVGTTIKIFTVSAHEVKELHTDGPSIAWDLTNDSGEKVASGIYLYLITDSQGDKVKGKLAIVR